MKKIIVISILVLSFLWLACELPTPSTGKINITANQQLQLLLRKIVAIGNSLTAGYQSAGLRKDFQEHSYPYLIAKQLGIDDVFEMPWIEAPGIGSTTLTNPNYVAGPLEMTPAGPAVTDSTLLTDIPKLLSNALLPRPYDNLAVPGADLNDMLNTLTSPSNPFFDIILRNPNLGNTTMLQQALLLNPSIIILWIGNNDVLGAALSGGDLSQITPQDEFQSKFNELLSTIRKRSSAQIVMANIPYVTDIPYVNALDGIFLDLDQNPDTPPVPVMFDSNLQPIDFNPDTAATAVLYLPLILDPNEQQAGVEHVLLPYLSIYQKEGIGIPDSAQIALYLMSAGMDQLTASAMAHQLKQGIMANGLKPTGQPIPGNLLLTASEVSSIKDAVDGFNNTLTQLAQSYKAVLIDANAMLTQLNTSGISGFTGKYVLQDIVNTAFSLDGVHPNNGGYAIVANAFIDAMNAAFGTSIPDIDPTQYKGQYVISGGGTAYLWQASERALQGVKNLFVRKKVTM